MSETKTKTPVPKLRFPEFQNAGQWGVAKLGNKEISTFVKERIPLEHLKLENYISTDNLLPDYAGVTMASKLPPAGSFTRFKKGDILISNIRPYLRKVWFATKDGASSNDVIVIRAQSDISNSFLNYLLKNDEFINSVMKGAKGVKMPRGDISLMKEYPVAFPKKTEQQRIADCLSSLDELISAQSKKLESLKAHKKGLMQQLFPAEGKTLPKLRFPEFQNAREWVPELLGNQTKKIGSGITPKGGSKNYKLDGRPFIRSQNIGWGDLLLKDVAYIDEATHLTFSNTEINEDDVLLNITGASIGRCAVAGQEINGGNVNQHVCIIRTKIKKLNPFFLSQFILSNSGQRQIDSFQAGGNREGLNFSQIRSFSIQLPPASKEQKEIADCLSSLDQLISAQSKKVELLKAHKKGLMQQLFPDPAP